MSDITTKFDDFKNKKIKKFDKEKEFQPLSDDIIAISKLDNGDIDFFDSFSSKPDHELKDIPKQFKMENGMEYPYLTKLLYESPYQIEYNDKVIQHKDSCCCGRYCAIRLSCPNLTIDEFNKLWSKDKKKNDLLSVKLTEN